MAVPRKSEGIASSQRIRLIATSDMADKVSVEYDWHLETSELGL